MCAKIYKLNESKIINEKVLDFDDDMFDDIEDADDVIPMQQTALDDITAKQDLDEAKQLIDRWLKCYINDNNLLSNGIDVVINPITGQIVVNCNGSINVSNCKISRFPFKWGKIAGHFNASGNKLTSFENFPSSIGGYLNANLNFIKNFKGVTRDVKKYVECAKQKVKTDYPLTEENYKKYLQDGEAAIVENLVDVNIKNETFRGELLEINEKQCTCMVKLLDSGKCIKASLHDTFPLMRMA